MPSPVFAPEEKAMRTFYKPVLHYMTAIHVVSEKVIKQTQVFMVIKTTTQSSNKTKPRTLEFIQSVSSSVSSVKK